ncbi:HET-domain-containing protein [Xylaria acuta]|nr:HET-domain-containing protein [Xylaria acuta]
MALPEVEFCSRCFTVFESVRDDMERPESWVHYSTYGQLSVSSTACFLCQLFVASLLSGLKEFVEDESSSLDEYPFKLDVLSARKMPSNITWASAVAFTQPEYSHWNSSSVSIEDSTSAVASWFHECCTNHAHIDDRWRQLRPGRLLSVGLDEKPIRLVRTDTIADTAQYATLSYCWGQSLQLKTTKASVKEFMEAVPAELLPATYNEFIKIARVLAIPYVWIDALCIIQDDEVEWQNEAARIGDIFQGSILTIAAVQSSDTSQGCFPVTDRVDLNNGALLRIRQQETERTVILARIYKDDIRGFNRQDSIIMSCMENDVHWQCQTCYKTQNGLEFGTEEMFSFNLQVLAPVKHSNPDDRQSQVNTWYRIVEKYTNRQFTYKTDRVSAIAGITKHMTSIFNDTPILGLWKRPLRMGLPSWTWLGYQGDLSYTLWTIAGSDTLQVQHTELLDWDIKWAGVDNASAVRRARVSIKGPVRDIPLASFDEGQKFNPPYLHGFGESVDYRGKTSIPWQYCGELDDGARMKPSIYFFKIYEIFLILESVDNSDTSTFRRIGLGQIRGPERTFNINNQMSISLL